MHNDPADARNLIDISIEHWPYMLVLLGMCAGWVVWAAYKIFPTHAGMEQCKNQILCALDEHKRFDDARIERFMDKNDEKHSAIEKKVDRLIEFIMKGGR